jgi:hypothetical protein
MGSHQSNTDYDGMGTILRLIIDYDGYSPGLISLTRALSPSGETRKSPIGETSKSSVV